MRVLFRTLLRTCGAAIVAAGAFSACGGPDTGPSGPAPDISCPAPLTVQVLANGVVEYPAPTASGGTPPLGTPACTPASGTPVPAGTTTVRCTVTDSRQRADACTFELTVQAAPQLTLTKFIAFGDSITLGEDGNSLRRRVVNPMAAYPAVLRRMLSDRYALQTISVLNLGQGAEFAASADARNRFSRELTTYQPEAVLIMEGSNDLGTRDSIDGVRAADSIRQMVREALGRGVRPFLGTIPPMIQDSRRGLAWILVGPYNDRLRQVAFEEGATFVDVHAGFLGQEATLISADGLHPTEAGYARIAEVFFEAIRSTLEAPPGS